MKKKNLIIVFVIGLIILCILIIVLSKLLNNRQQTEDVQNDIEAKQKAIEEYCEDKVTPRGLSTLYGNYKGQNSKDDLYRNFNLLVQYLPNLYTTIKEMNDEELASYAEENYSKIKRYLGIEEVEPFVEFAKYIQTTNLENVTFNSAEIDDTTYEDDGKYLNFNLQLVYDGLKSPINVKVSFANAKVTRPQVVYGVIEN